MRVRARGENGTSVNEGRRHNAHTKQALKRPADRKKYGARGMEKYKSADQRNRSSPPANQPAIRPQRGPLGIAQSTAADLLSCRTAARTPQDPRHGGHGGWRRIEDRHTSSLGGPTPGARYERELNSIERRASGEWPDSACPSM